MYEKDKAQTTSHSAQYC